MQQRVIFLVILFLFSHLTLGGSLYTFAQVEVLPTPPNQLSIPRMFFRLRPLVVNKTEPAPLFAPLTLPMNSLLRQLQNWLSLPRSTLGSSFWSCSIQSLVKLSLFKISSSFTARVLNFLVFVSVLLEYLPTACSKTSCEGRLLPQMRPCR